MLTRLTEDAHPKPLARSVVAYSSAAYAYSTVGPPPQAEFRPARVIRPAR